LKSKTKLPTINKNNFPYKFYLAYWIDTNSTSTWENLESIKRNVPSICITTGWLVSTNNNSHTFVGDVGFNDDGSINECGNTTCIPSQNIIKLKRIKI